MQNRLINVSNRLPVKLEQISQGNWEITPGMGGLVTALVPVLRNRGGVWIGWPGVVDEDGVEDLDGLLARASEEFGYTVKSVALSQEEKEQYYEGFANEIIWPSFHDLQTLCNFDPDYWRAYCQVNRKFANVVTNTLQPGDYVWIHDYHLMAVAEELRAIGVRCPIGYFLHIPFPPLDIFLKIPWRMEILRSLLEYDLIGFQTSRDRRNFLQCLREVVPEASIRGRGRVLSIYLGDRRILIGNFPISIDFTQFETEAEAQAVKECAWYIHEALPERQIVLGIDRLDYTKGIPYRLQAFSNLLERYSELRGKISLIQVVVPSRTEVPKYQELRTEIERLVGEINGKFTQSGWIPIHYICRALTRTELLGYYLTAEIALITPLKDGMNLIAKEYCAVNSDHHGTLILSEFAGAASQLQRGAILVNPYHIEEVADAIHRAFHMSDEERRSRMNKLRRTVRKHDIYWWVDSFLRVGIAKDLRDFPILEEYMPRLEMSNQPGDEASPKLLESKEPLLRLSDPKAPI